jgi:hypothetical protein
MAQLRFNTRKNGRLDLQGFDRPAPGALDVPTRRGLGGGQVMPAEGRENIRMLSGVDGPPHARAEDAGSDPYAMDVYAEIVVVAAETWIPRQADKQDVKLAVGQGLGQPIAGVGGRAQADDLSQPLPETAQKGDTDVHHPAFEGVELAHEPQIVQLDQIVGVEAGDAEPAAAEGLHEALSDKPGKRIANGGPADMELRGQLIQPQALPGRDAAIRDGLQESRVDVLIQAAELLTDRWNVGGSCPDGRHRSRAHAPSETAVGGWRRR